MRPFEAAVVAAGAAYLLVLGWAMQSLSYDIWGALVVVPVLALISAPLIMRAFTGELTVLRPWLWAGMFVKFAGGVVGYSVRFDAYGGNAAAGRYHAAGKELAGAVRDGSASLLEVLPSSTGTRSIEEFTGLVYTIFGSSRMGGFMVFTWLSFWGLVFFVKAAHHAVPGLATRRYLLWVMLFPSLVYWGSSIGKEAVVGFFLGLTAYGAALVLARRGKVGFGTILIAIGLSGSAFVRPHFAAIWAGAIVIALASRVALDAMGRSARADGRRRLQLGSLLLVVIAGIGFAVIASITLNYLGPSDDDDVATTDQFSSIFERTENQTTQGGSSFTPIDINGPQDWPYATFRTITRPLLTEARGLATLLPALEMTALLFVGIFSWRRLANAPKLMLTTPYVVFALLCVVTFGVAFASIGNLGILTRQRSLILPLVLLFWCLPPIVFASERARTAPASTPGMPAGARAAT
jgi:hypothetical protein